MEGKEDYSPCPVFISGKPAIEVNIEPIPATKAVEPTSIQSTSPIIVVVPIVAIAVYAMVFIARIPAHFSHFLK